MEGEQNPDGSRANKWKVVSIQQVEDVKCLARIVPIWAAGILGFTSMAQQGTFTVSQANVGQKMASEDINQNKTQVDIDQK